MAGDEPSAGADGSSEWIAGMRRIASPHPSRLAADELLRQCELTLTRRGGPGGQHRNKTSTAVVLHHRPSCITAEASERRSQSDNRRVALQRLRLALAVHVRCDFDATSGALRRQYGGGQLRVSAANADYPAVISLLLDDLVSAGGQPQPVSERWDSSASQILRLLRSHPPALAALNRCRAENHLRPLR